MAISVSGSGVNSGSSNAAVTGNGAVYNNDGVLIGREHYAFAPLKWLHSSGIDGPPILTIQPGYLQLGKLIGASGTITTDQAIPILGATKYIIDKIVFANASVAPVEITGGIYTYINKGGEQVVPAAQTYTALTAGEYNSLVLTPTEVVRAAPYLYLSLTTPNAAAVTFDIYVFGRVLEGVEG